MVKKILYLEGAVFFLMALYTYHVIEGNWLFFILLFLSPDISMIGYLKNNSLGAHIYNLVHNYVLALILIFLGVFILDNSIFTHFGIILFAHVAMDRTFGYGLKYPTHFKQTHLQKV